jgi:hypothetical protein
VSGQTPSFRTRKYRLSVGGNVENTPGALNKYGMNAKGLSQFLRQTGGLLSEASRRTVINFYPHHYTPLIIKEPLK